jgi:hypothetical protein
MFIPLAHILHLIPAEIFLPGNQSLERMSHPHLCPCQEAAVKVKHNLVFSEREPAQKTGVILMQVPP